MDNKLVMGLAIADIEDAKNLMFRTLDEHLSNRAKHYDITYKGVKYDFYPAFDPEDILEITKERHKFINAIVKDSLKMSLNRTKDKRDKAWENIFGILGGARPEDHQFEKYSDEDIYEIKGPNGEDIKSIPLNFDNYQVRENMGALSQDQDTEEVTQALIKSEKEGQGDLYTEYR